MSGTARPRAEVELVRHKTSLSYLARTDETGLCVIVARLGDESAGEAFLVRSGDRDMTVTARFDPSDHGHEHGTRVDFVGASPVETAWEFLAAHQRFLAR